MDTYRCSREEMGLAQEYSLAASLKPLCGRLIAGGSALVWDVALAMRWMLRVIARRLPACPAGEPVMRSIQRWSGSRCSPAREARRCTHGESADARLDLLVSYCHSCLALYVRFLSRSMVGKLRPHALLALADRQHTGRLPLGPSAPSCTQLHRIPSPAPANSFRLRR